MKLEKFNIQSCCGGVSIIFKTDRPLNINHLTALVKLDFVEAEHFTAAGILYATNLDFIVTGPFGSDKLQVKCKHTDCVQKMNDFEVLLQQLE